MNHYQKPYPVVYLKEPAKPDSLDQALRLLKKKLQTSGIFRELKERQYHVKPSDKKKSDKRKALLRSNKKRNEEPSRMRRMG